MPLQPLDSLKQQLSEQITSRQYSESLDTIASIKASGHDYEAEIFYFQGIAYLYTKQFNAAKAALGVYIELSGSEGQYFQDALERIDHLENSPDSAKPGSDESIASSNLESKLCEDLRVWQTTRQLTKKSTDDSRHICGSHYSQESNGKRTIIWQTKER